MKQEKLWEKKNSNFTYFNTIEELLESLKTKETTSISIKNEYIPGMQIEMSEESIYLDKDINAIYTDSNHPACLTGIFEDTIVDPIFFEKNKEKIIEVLKENALKSSIITIKDYLYSDELIREIIEKNDEAKIIFENIKPSNSIINLLKDNYIESSLIIDGKDQILSTKYAVQSYTFKHLKLLDNIRIKSTVTDEEINNLSYCSDNMIIHIVDDLEEPEYLNNVKKILEKIKDKNLTIRINCEKRSNLEKSNILNLKFKNLKIVINNDSYYYSFEEYKKEETRLNEMVENIKNSTLSPFEKYIAVYDIVKNYKEYNENEEDKNKSRYLRYILDNEYMVCVGYSKLFKTLLDKVGIESMEYLSQVDISYDKGFTEEETPLTHAGHSRLLVNIKDEKYKINGFYTSDPTWDNNLKNDLYGNLIMPMDYMQKSKRLFKLQDLDYIFDVHNLEEYKTKISILIRKKLSKITPESRNNYNPNIYSPIQITEKIEKKYKKDIAYELKSIYFKIINTIKNLDYDKYLQLKEKYNYLNDSLFSIDNIENKIEKYYDFFIKIGPYIVSKSNNEIPKETIINGITNTKIKQGLLLPQNVEEYRDLLEENLEIQDLNNRPYEFPENYLTEHDDGVTIYPKQK